MKNSKFNNTKANKKPLDKILWFLLLSWLLLLLLLALFSMYQKEGIIDQDDLGNTLFSTVSTFYLLAIVGAPIWLYFISFFLTYLPFGPIFALPLTILVCGSIGYFTPYWTSLKFDNEAKVLTVSEHSLSNGKQKVMIPYNGSKFMAETQRGNNIRYQIYLEIPKKVSALNGEPSSLKYSLRPSSTRYEERWLIYDGSFFRFWGEIEHRDKTLQLFSSLINDNTN